jgi:hypothetical protein
MNSPNNYHGHPAFYRIVEELKELHSEKNRQYATKDNPLGNFERTGKMISKFLKPGINPTLASCLALVSKQIDGVYELVGECKKNTADSLEDKLRDIAVYTIIAMIIIEESREKSPLVELQERAGQFYRPETPVTPGVCIPSLPPEEIGNCDCGHSWEEHDTSSAGCLVKVNGKFCTCREPRHTVAELPEGTF